MKTAINIYYNRRKKLKSDGTAPIDISLFNNKKRVYISTGISVMPKNWSEKQNSIIKLPNATHLNAVIRSYFDRVDIYEQKCLKNNTAICVDKMKDFLINGGKVENITLVDFAKEQTTNETIKYSTLKKNLSIINTFGKLMGNITLSDFNYESILKYNKLLNSVQRLGKNTIIGHNKVISKYVSLAVKLEIIDKNPYSNYTIGTMNCNRESLNKGELQSLEKLELPDNNILLHQLRDMFVFCCYCGLRFSDMQALSRKDIVKTDDGLSIRFVMQKVDRAQFLPLYSLFDGKAERIVKKYLEESITEEIFPRITNQAMNRSLKLLAVMIGTSVKLSSHIARHTFGTMLADTTQNPYLIMQLMGHRDITTSMIYIHFSEEKLERQVRDVKW